MNCIFRGCFREARSRGWCASHYQQFSRHGLEGLHELHREPELVKQLGFKVRANEFALLELLAKKRRTTTYRLARSLFLEQLKLEQRKLLTG